MSAAAMAGKGLEGQVALVTGGAKRVGRSIALGLASDGANVVVNYMESKAEAEQLVQEIRAMGPRAIAIGGDVSKRQDVEKLFMAAENEFGRLDILVNNAGIFQAVKFEDLTEEQWDHMMNVNLKSQFLCAQEAAPIMKRQGRGRIINLVSLGVWPSYTHYCVSKAGCIMLTQCLARALGPEILVNSVAPGTIQFPGELPDEDYIRRVPLHRTGTCLLYTSHCGGGGGRARPSHAVSSSARQRTRHCNSAYLRPHCITRDVSHRPGHMEPGAGRPQRISSTGLGLGIRL